MKENQVEMTGMVSKKVLTQKMTIARQDSRSRDQFVGQYVGKERVACASGNKRGKMIDLPCSLANDCNQIAKGGRVVIMLYPRLLTF